MRKECSVTRLFPVERIPQVCSPEREGAHERPKSDSTKVQLDEPVGFIGVSFRSVGEESLTGVSPKPTTPFI